MSSSLSLLAAVAVVSRLAVASMSQVTISAIQYINMTGVMEGGSSWCDLPADILNEIAKRLLYIEQIRFQSVCKNWRSNTNTVKHVADKLPWVMSFVDYFGARGSFYLYDPSQKRKYTLQNEILIGAKVHASKHGWLLFSKKNQASVATTFFFYTPFTNKIIQLQELKLENDLSKATFSTAPTSSNCVVFVSTVHYRKLYIYVNTRRPGSDDQTWSSFLFDIDYYGEVDSLAFVGGVFYCFFFNGVMGSFKVEQQEWKIHPNPLYHRANHCLIESHDGNLLVICHGLYNNSPQIFRYDHRSEMMKWFEVENLGNRMLFLGVTSTLLPAVEEATELANTIHALDYMWIRYLDHRIWIHYFGISFSSFQPLCPQTYDWINDETQPSTNIWIQPPKQT
ncbi:hypothetical protein LWI28_016542 [Acer negundo]|uniref:F-box domain-containing protein n=1 Tax=Acer negundo TaxID=4023 RepID=A0AAD5J9V7_ACENE|nr:hypothetical protein LWI28_016542 [Acer negundo]